MIFDRIEHYDHFGDVTVFWADISGMPDEIQREAVKIDGREYNPGCFGVCVNYIWDEKSFVLVTDTDFDTGDSRNVYYIDVDGDKHWFNVEFDPQFIEGIFAACGEELKSIPPSEIIVPDEIKEGKNDMENFDDLFSSRPDQHEDAAFDKSAWAAKKQQERDQVYDLIDTYVRDMGSTEGLNFVNAFQTYLDVQARFDRYSVSNAVLIAAQMPEATRLADFDAWKDSGVYVKRGAEAITILEPGKEYTRQEDGSTGVFYNPKKVFDISQTSADQQVAPIANRDERLLLKALMNNAPCRFQIANDMPEGVNVFYNSRDNVIFVRRGLDATTIFRGLAQELAIAHMSRSVTA